jgi:uncharacterized SAM-binding protein YcdF (DUF218 family)
LLITLILLATTLLISHATTRVRGIRRTLSLAVAGVIVLISVGWIPQLLMPLMTQTEPSSESTHKKAVFVLLGGGLAKSIKGEETIPFYAFARISAAAQAYHHCMTEKEKCRILISGGSVQGAPSEASLYGKALVSMGVPEASLTLEERSLNTWQNAQFSQPLINDTESVSIITNGLHARRSQVYFRHFGVNANVISADHFPVQLSPWQWGLNWFVFEVEVHELIGLARYSIYEALGLNGETRRGR